jgi:hypothetical protein
MKEKAMKRLLKLIPVAPVAALITVTSVEAHHSFSMFDRSTEMVTTGKVVRWAFNNPHSWLYINVTNDDGTETLWSFEGSAPPSLIGRGITGSTFEPGDTLTLMFCPLVDGRPGGAMGWAQLEDGSYINPSDGGCNGNDESIARWKGWLEKGFTSNKEAQSAQ